jgi:hypothetical protein
LHAAPCPALARDGDWCHEDLPVDLPPWLVPVARTAGLRREGLTFSYVVLRKDGVRLADALESFAPRPRAGRLRVVSSAMPSKGKLEAFVCGELWRGGAAVPARVRATRLDRDSRIENSAWSEVGRGDLLVVDPALELERPRVEASTVVISGEREGGGIAHLAGGAKDAESI